MIEKKIRLTLFGRIIYELCDRKLTIYCYSHLRRCKGSLMYSTWSADFYSHKFKFRMQFTTTYSWYWYNCSTYAMEDTKYFAFNSNVILAYNTCIYLFLYECASFDMYIYTTDIFTRTTSKIHSENANCNTI